MKYFGIFILQYLSNNQDLDYLRDSQNLQKIDSSLANCGVSSFERQRIYKILAAILHLGNISFKEIESNEECIFSESSIVHVVSVAQMLDIDQTTLESALLKRTINVKESDQIMYVNSSLEDFIKFKCSAHKFQCTKCKIS